VGPFDSQRLLLSFLPPWSAGAYCPRSVAAGRPRPRRNSPKSHRCSCRQWQLKREGGRSRPLLTTPPDRATLQAAGFDVIASPRDLDGDTLRKSFRDFIKKAVGIAVRYEWRFSTPRLLLNSVAGENLLIIPGRFCTIHNVDADSYLLACASATTRAACDASPESQRRRA